MYCPDCGKAEQLENTYCRGCGEFLVGKNNRGRHGQPVTPDDRIKLSLVFNVLSAIASFGASAFLLISHINREGTHFSVFLALSLLFVIGTWQTVSFFNNLKLRKRFRRNHSEEGGEESNREKSILDSQTKELLPEADLSEFVPASVTENTTKNLTKTSKSSRKTSK